MYTNANNVDICHIPEINRQHNLMNPINNNNVADLFQLSSVLCTYQIFLSLYSFQILENLPDFKTDGISQTI